MYVKQLLSTYPPLKPPVGSCKPIFLNTWPSRDCYLAFGMNLHLPYHKCLSSEQCPHRLEKYLNIEGFLEKSLKTKSALKSTGESLQYLEMSLNFTILCRTTLLVET